MRSNLVVFFAAAFWLVSIAVAAPVRSQQQEITPQQKAEEENATLIETHQKLREQVERLTDELIVLETQLADMLITLQARLAKHKEERKRLQQLVDTQQGHIQTLRQDIDHTRLALTKAQQTIDTLQQQLQSIRADNQQWQTRHAETRRALVEAQERLQSTETERAKELAQAQETYEQVTQQLETVVQQRKALGAEIAQSEEKVQQLEATRMSQEQDLTRLRQDTAQLQQTLTTTRQQRDKAQQEAQQWQQHTAATQTLTQLREELQRTSAEGTTLRQQIEEQAAQQARKAARTQALYNRVTDELKEAVQQRKVTVQQAPGRLTIRVGGEALFRPGRVSLRAESRKVLDKIATALQAFPGYHVQVEGHTDNVPMGGKARDRWPTNWELSAARAATVVRYLQEQGIAPDQLTASGSAFYHPMASNDTPEGRAQNRRIELTVLLPAASHESNVTR